MPIVQEYIHGDGYGVEVLFNHGEPRAIFMHKRLREYPATGGERTLWESVYNERMKNIALDLMGEIEWHGVTMVDFKLDAKDRVPELMEVNGRFGQLPLLIAPGVGFPGVDLPYLPCTMAAEGDVGPAFGDCARVGCRPARAILRDLLCHAASLGDGGRGSEAIRGFLRSGGMGCEVLSKRDLLPAVGAMRVAAHWIGMLSAGMRGEEAMG